MEYRVAIRPSAQRQFGKLPVAVQLRVATGFRLLAANPRPPGSKQLKGSDGLWRLRIGDYRVVYRIVDARLVVLVIRVGHRSEVYRAAALKRARRG